MPNPVERRLALVHSVLVALAMTVVLSVGLQALAQDATLAPDSLPDGSEVVVTDRQGEHLLGYGRVAQGVLRLSLARDDEDGLAVVVIRPDGEVATLVGRFAGDDVRVRAPGSATDVTLLDWMSERGVTLALERVAHARDDDEDDDEDEDGRDDRDEAPPSVPSDDDADHDDGDDGDGADDDGADDDGADDDGADDDGADDDAPDDDGDDEPDHGAGDPSDDGADDDGADAADEASDDASDGQRDETNADDADDESDDADADRADDDEADEDDGIDD